MASADLLNLDEIRQFVADMGGDPGIIPVLVVSLEDDVNRSIKEMRDAVEHANGKQLRQAAHRLKSSCASLGATQAAALCQELENIGQSDEIENAAPMVERLQGICVQSINALRELSL
jgi:two-component system, sensor histidine kinase and response regulator